MKKIVSLSSIAMALMLAGCGGSSNKVINENIDVQVKEDTTYEHTLAAIGSNIPVVTQLATNGNIQITNNGFNYVPSGDFFGSDTATIEVGKTRYIVKVNVSAENDLPTISATDMKVSATSEIEGQIVVNDIDDETVTVTLKTAPQSGELTLSADGSFVYKNSDLTLPNLSFEVTLDDSHGETVDFTINLSAAYASNTDKANYYYASSQSHLKQAEQRIDSLKDDALILEAYTAVAQGYALASLDDQAAAIIDEKITLEHDKMQVFVKIATTYNKLGKDSFASKYLNKSLQSMLTYFAETGIDNISKSDIGLLVDIFHGFRTFATDEDLSTALSSLNFVFSQLKKTDYTFQYGRLVQEQRDVMLKLVGSYLKLANENPNKETLRKQAVTALKIYVEQSKDAGLQYKTINDIEKQPYFGIAPFYISTAVTYAMALKETGLAKDFLAQTLSYYSDVNYDNNYQYTANEHAGNSLAGYRFPLVSAVRDFSLLYPNADTNIPLKIYDFQSDADKNFRRTLDREKPITDAFLAVENGRPLSAAIDTLKLENPGAAYSQQDQLVKRSLGNHSLANALFNSGNNIDALSTIEEGMKLLFTTDTLVEVRGNWLRTLGKYGCYKYINEYSKRGLTDSSKATAQRCHDEMYVPHYAAYFENSDSPYKTYDPSYIVLAQTDLFFAVGDNVKVTKLLTDTEQYITQLDIDDQIKYYAEYGHRAMAASSFEKALTYFEKGKALILQDETLTGTSAIRSYLAFNKLINTYDYYDSTALIYSAENELRRRGYNDEKYASSLKQLNEIAAAVNQKLVVLIVNESVSTKSSYGDDVVEALASNRQYTAAQTLIDDLELGEADNNELVVLISMIQALQEDFPGSTIASVDTDNNGKTNFFAITATDEEKEQSDITLDNDADGDGITDEDDPTPLG
jgi:hypothetical protein